MNNIFKSHKKWLALAVLIVSCFLNSCKKDILLPKLHDSSKENKMIVSISYAQFLKSINLNNTGALKQSLSMSNGMGAPSTSNEALSVLNLDMDSVKRLTVKDTISYVLSIKPEYRKAVSFRNLTIQVANGKTTAFITTYTPTKDWVNKWRAGTNPTYKGNISATTINLQGQPVVNMSAGNLAGRNLKMSAEGSAILLNDHLISFAAPVCQTYFVYGTIYIPCKEGHYSRVNCTYFDYYGGTWDPTPLSIANGDYPPSTHTGVVGWTYECEEGGGSGGNGGGGGSGGGGNTTPNPPPGYDPCCDLPTPPIESVIFEKGTRLQVIPPPECPCDEPPPPVLPPIDPDIINNVLGPLPYISNEEISYNPSVIVTTPNLNYSVAGLSVAFTTTEFDALVNNLSNDINNDGIQLYMLASYKASKILSSSTYSIANNSFKVGDYVMTPHYNGQNQLVFYSAYRNSTNGIEYIVKASELSKFAKGVDHYSAAANLFYLRGKPTQGMIQLVAGDYWEGIKQLHIEAYSDPNYYIYIANIFIGVSTNLKTAPNKPTPEPIKFTTRTLTKKSIPNIVIENVSWQNWKNAISSKFNLNWTTVATDVHVLISGDLKYVARMEASQWAPGYTIEYWRNGILIGKFRFNN